MSLPPGMREAPPQRTQQAIPEFYVGQKLEGEIVSMTPSTYDSDKGPRDQIQFDVKLKPTGYEARAWISYYKLPNPKQKIGQLYLAIQRITGNIYQNVDEAMEALKTHGRIFFEMTGFRAVGTTSYPKFIVIANMLPGEGVQQPTQQTKIPQPESPSAISDEAYNWLVACMQYIGKPIPDNMWNLAVNQRIVGDLAKNNLVEVKDELHYLSEEARSYL